MPTAEQMITIYDQRHTLEELKSMCKEQGLSTHGTKRELIKKLLEIQGENFAYPKT